MAPKRTTRSTRVPPVTPTPNEPTTTVTEVQLQALIDQGVAARGKWLKQKQAGTEGVVELIIQEKTMSYTDGLRKWSLCFSIINSQSTYQVKFADLHSAR
ncbi:hypothetical protein Tco_1501196 [Tanacetum coccineum]